MALEKIAPPNLPLSPASGLTSHFFEQFSNVLRLFFVRLVRSNNDLIDLTTYLYNGTGSPEGVVTAAPGSMYFNTSGGAGTTLYVKESGVSNTGWVAK